MPHSLDERATSLAVRRIAQSEEIRDFLSKGVSRNTDDTRAKLESTQVPPGGRRPSLVLAIDGSLSPVPVLDGFPGSEVAYFSFACVLLDIELVGKLEAERPANPAAFSQTRAVTPHVMVLPGRNFRHQQDVSPSASFRRVVFEQLSSHGLDTSTETLLQTYEALLANRSTASEPPKCPNSSCPNPTARLTTRSGTEECSCAARRPVYSTDWLRIQEGFNELGENGAAYSEFMQVAERLWLVHFLRTLEKKKMLSILGKIGFVLDGPLAIFGHPAWLKDAIRVELTRLNSLIKSETGEDILLIGIEKTGQFVEHFLALDRNAKGSPNQIKERSLYLLNDDYIKRNIIMSESEQPYGYQTYFGRKFLYKTKTGAMIVGSTPFLRADDSELSTAQPAQHPRLADVLYLLDELVSSRYPNATVPLVEAHAQAAIARGLNAEILERLTRNSVGSSNGR